MRHSTDAPPSKRPCGHELAPAACPVCPLEAELERAKGRAAALALELQNLEAKHARLEETAAILMGEHLAKTYAARNGHEPMRGL